MRLKKLLNQHQTGGNAPVDLTPPPSDLHTFMDPEFAEAFKPEPVTPAPVVVTPPAPAAPVNPVTPVVPDNNPAPVVDPNKPPVVGATLELPPVALPESAAPAGNNQPAGDSTLQYRNHADLVLNQILGANVETLDFNGQMVPVASLSEAQQAEVIYNSFQDMQAFYEGELAKGGLVDERENAIINAFRASQGDVTKFVDSLYQAHPTLQASKLTNEELVLNSLKQRGYNDLEAAAELNTMASDKIEREAGVLRRQLQATPGDNKEYLAKLPKYQLEPAKDPELLADLQQLQQYANTVTQIDGVPLKPENVQYLFELTGQVDAQTRLTPFTSQLVNPEGVMRAAFWSAFGPQMYQQRQHDINNAYLRGQQAAQKKIISQYPDQPHVTVNSNPHLNPEDIDWEKMNQVNKLGT